MSEDRNSEGGFYYSMREGHKYNACDFEYLDKYAQEYFASLEAENNSPSVHRGSTAEPGGSIINTSLCDSDVNPLAPICIGMDYNANINWIVAGQPEGRRLNIIKSFYVKFERKIPALVEEFCNYYAHHQNKTVVYYYDTTALGANYAVNEQDFHWVVCHEFEKRGCQVEDVYLGNPMRHDEKYLLIN